MLPKVVSGQLSKENAMPGDMPYSDEERQLIANSAMGQWGGRTNQDRSRAMDMLARDPALMSKFAEAAGVGRGVKPGIGRDSEGGETALNTAQMSRPQMSQLDAMMQPAAGSTPPLPPRRPQQGGSTGGAGSAPQRSSRVAEMGGDERSMQPAPASNRMAEMGNDPRSRAPGQDGGSGAGAAYAAAAAGAAAVGYLIYRQSRSGAAEATVVNPQTGEVRPASPQEIVSLPSKVEYEAATLPAARGGGVPAQSSAGNVYGNDVVDRGRVPPTGLGVTRQLAGPVEEEAPKQLAAPPKQLEYKPKTEPESNTEDNVNRSMEEPEAPKQKMKGRVKTDGSKPTIRVKARGIRS